MTMTNQNQSNTTLKTQESAFGLISCHSIAERLHMTEPSRTFIYPYIDSVEVLEFAPKDVDVISVKTIEHSLSYSSFTSVLGKRRRFLGLICAVLSSFVFSLTSVIVRYLTHISPHQLAALRFIIIMIPTLPMLAYNAKQPFLQYIFPKKKFWLLFLRAVAGAFIVMLEYYSFQEMQLADATVIQFSVPIFVIVLARFFLQETCGVINIACIILTFLGLLLIARPSFMFSSPNNKPPKWEGVAAAFAGTIFSSGAYIILRKLRSVPAEVVVLHLVAVAMVIAGGILSAQLMELCMPGCYIDRLLLLALGLLSFAGQLFLTLALKWEEAGPVSIVRTTNILFAFAWQAWIFHEVPSVLTIVGAFLVTSSVLAVGMVKWLTRLPRESAARHWLGWMLK